jgi:hypothetical protein
LTLVIKEINHGWKIPLLAFGHLPLKGKTPLRKFPTIEICACYEIVGAKVPSPLGEAGRGWFWGFAKEGEAGINGEIATSG